MLPPPPPPLLPLMLTLLLPLLLLLLLWIDILYRGHLELNWTKKKKECKKKKGRQPMLLRAPGDAENTMFHCGGIIHGCIKTERVAERVEESS